MKERKQQCQWGCMQTIRCGWQTRTQQPAQTAERCGQSVLLLTHTRPCPATSGAAAAVWSFDIKAPPHRWTQRSACNASCISRHL